MSEPTVNELLAAERTLTALNATMEKEFQTNGLSWPRKWMQKHVNDRAAILRIRALLLDRAESKHNSEKNRKA